MSRSRAWRVVGVVVLAGAAVVSGATPSEGQDAGLLGLLTTTTTAPPGSSPTTVAPPDDGGNPTSTVAPPSTVADPEQSGEEPPAGEGESSSGVVPPDAQARIDAYPRTGPSSSAELFAAMSGLTSLGMGIDDAVRVGFGQFPVGGVSRYIHDWLYPRFGATGFRHHQGTDVVAAFGTPLRAVTAGTVSTSNYGLGGLVVRVHESASRYYYYAHLSALAEGLVDGATVEQGQVIGYVGDSGNARGGTPHLHFGIYENGHALDPKPVLDRWLAEAETALADVIATAAAARAGDPDVARLSGARSLLATNALRPLMARTAAGVVATEVLYRVTSNPASGGMALAEQEAMRLGAGIDWKAEADAAARRRDAASAVVGIVGTVLGVPTSAGADAGGG